MLLKHRAREINSAPVHPRQGLEHLDTSWVQVLRWLNEIKLDYVVVGPVAHAIRGDLSARGPVAIVPAPYSRNFERLATGLVAQHAGLRSDRGLSVPAHPGDRSATVAVKLTGDKLARGRRWMLSFGGYDLDVEGAGKRAAGARAMPDGSTPAPGYQELLYEAGRFQLAEGVSVEVASPEDLEHFSHVRRTGSAPEFRVTRTPPAPTPAADQPNAGQPPADQPTGGQPTADQTAADQPTAGETDAPTPAEGQDAGERRQIDASPET